MGSYYSPHCDENQSPSEAIPHESHSRRQNRYLARYHGRSLANRRRCSTRPEVGVACVLTGHALKDPNVTVNYHKDKLGEFSNAPVEVPNDLAEIIKLIR